MGKSPKNDCAKLLARNPEIIEKPLDYDSIVRLFPRRNDVDDYNINKLRQAEQKNIPIAKIVAEHYGDKKAQKTRSQDMWGLDPVIYICRGAEVMLNNNLLPAKYGLVNGSRGTVIDILYDGNHLPESCPKCVIVEVFSLFRKPRFLNPQL